MSTTSIPTCIPTSISRLMLSTALLLSGFLISASAQASSHITPDDFVTEWQIGGSVYATFNSEGRYTIDWGDGSAIQTIDSNVLSLVRHQYTNTGYYTVVISNGITRFVLDKTGFEDLGTRSSKMRNIRQWGTAEWSSMMNAFQGATEMTMSAIDAPNLSGVSSMASMFRFNTKFNGDIGGWDVSNVTTMRSMFYDALNFNRDLSRWNVSNVTTMRSMFHGTEVFNGDISTWNVSKVTTMEGMFRLAIAFNGDIGNWDVSSVTLMGNELGASGMFRFAAAFDQDISRWDVSSVTDMRLMFAGATAFNQDISGWDISSWVYSTAFGPFRMFNRATDFNQNLGPWYIVATTALNITTLATQNLELSNQNPVYALASGDGDNDRDNGLFTLNLIDSTLSPSDPDLAVGIYNVRVSAVPPSGAAANAFFGSNNARSLSIVITDLDDASLSGLDLSAGTLSPVFASTTASYTASVTNPISSLTLTPTSSQIGAGVTVNGGAAGESITLLEGVNTITIEVTATDTTTRQAYTLSVTRAAGADKFVTKWRIPSGDVAARTLSFPGTGSNYTINWGDGTATTTTSTASDHTYAVAGDYTVIASNAITRFNLNDGEDKQKLIDVSQWGDANWSSMQTAFYGASAMKMSAMDTPDLTSVTEMNMELMFREATLFNSANINNWNISKVTNMQEMFSGATAFNQGLNSWDVSKVTNMQEMFSGATAFNQGLNSWDVSKVTTMYRMFFSSTGNAFNGNILSWNVSSVTNMAGMFINAEDFNQNISMWNVSSVTDMNTMFSGADTFDQDIGSWDVRNVDMTDMFQFASNFNQNLGRWYIVATATGNSFELAAQNDILGGHSPTYTLVTGADLFDLNDGILTPKVTTPPTPIAIGTYNVRVAASTTTPDGTALFGGTTANEHTLSISITDPTDATLSALGLSVGTLSPAFASNTSTYTLSFANPLSSLTLTPSTSQIGASVTLNGNALASGTASAPIALVEGVNTITIEVTATDTMTTQPYTLIVTRAAGADKFITKWRMPAGDETARTLSFPGTGSNYSINWGDGTATTTTSTASDHTYTTPGDYTVIASNTITRFNLNNGEDKEKLIDVQQWGNASWSSMQGAFHGASAMTMSATDVPDLSGVSNMRNMFEDARTFNQDISGWNVARVTNMRGLFVDAHAFNADISGWNVANVENMQSTFNRAYAFDQNIGSWNVEQVTVMSYMFAEAQAFNQDIGGWNVARVTAMIDMFRGVTASGQNLGRWYILPTTSSTTTTLTAQNPVLSAHNPSYMLVAGDGDSDNGLFEIIGSTLSPIDPDQALATYNVRVAASTSTGGTTLFGSNNARSLSIELLERITANDFVSQWTIPDGDDTARTRTLTFPSEGNYNIDWGDGSVIEAIRGTNPEHIYAAVGDYQVIASNGITRFNLNDGEDKEKLIDVEQWGSASWSSMAGAFNGASAMTMSASDAPDLSSVSSMQVMFRNATVFNGNIGDWDVSKVRDMSDMFAAATAFDSDISLWDVSNVTTIKSMFNGAAAFNQDIGNWNVASVTDMNFAFKRAAAFNQDIGNWNVASVTFMEQMFLDATRFNQDISRWNVGMVTNMQDMLDNTPASSQNLGRWYIVPTTTTSTTTTLTTQNTVLSAHNPTYALVAGDGDSNNGLFMLSSTGVLSPNYPNQAYGTYNVRVAANPTTGEAALFGSDNARSLSIQIVDPITPADFVSHWRIPAGDEAAPRTLTFPGAGSYTIDWGDRSPIENASGASDHTYAAAGDYRVLASNGITHFNLNNGEDKEKLIDVQQWGSANWSSMQGAFHGASAMRMSASDAPNLTGVSSMQNMFQAARRFNSDISNWDVSNVENMGSMFNSATAFNQDIGGWDVSSVENMSTLFNSATAFNQDISHWNVASVSNMTNIFQATTAFNQNLGRWYVSPSPASPSPTLSAQNSVLIAQSPAYTLLAGDGDSNNNLFTLSSAGVLSPSDPNQVTATYSLRIGISEDTSEDSSESSSGAATFGSNNAVIIRVMVVATATTTTPALYTISVPSDAELAAETSVAVATSTPTISAVAGIAISAVTIDSTGAAVASYAIAPAIGNGLSFDTSTGTISGTPDKIAPTVTYTITASNSAGSTTTTVAISVANAYSSSVMATAVINADATIITLGQSANNTIQVVGATITLPSGLRGATISIAEASNNVPTVQPLGTAPNSRLSLVDITVTGVSSSNPVTICLPHQGIADPSLYHAATSNAWDLLPSQQVVDGLVCGNAIAFSPFAVFGKRQDLAAVAEEQIINAVLPQLLRATTKISVDNISRRIDQALDASGRSPAKLTIGSSSNLQQLLNNNIRTVLQNELNAKQMLNNSSFSIPLNLARANNKGLNNMTLWGSGDYLSLGDDVSGVEWEGEIVGASIGIDTRLKRNLVAGAALAYSDSAVDYQRDGTNNGTNNSSGKLSNTLYSIHPYMAYNLSRGWRIWGTLGYGQGELTINDTTSNATDDTVADTFKSQRDTQLQSLALGGRGKLSSTKNWLRIIPGTTTLSLKGEVSLATIKLAKSQLINAQALTIDAHRYRMVLEASQQHTLASRARISPSIELGIRYDAGSGETTGGGIELAGNYRYRSPKGLDMELRAHTLLVHQSNYQEWGLSGLVKYQARRSGQGLRLSLQPTWGKTPGNVADRIWQASAVTDYANAANEADTSNNKLQLNSELGYGFPGFYGHGLLTPYAGLGIANGKQSYNIGTRWTIDPKSKLNLIGERKQSGDSIQLRGDFSF